VHHLPALTLIVACLAPRVALCDLYQYSATLTLSFGGGTGPAIASAGLVDVTAGGVSGQKLVSLTLAPSAFVGSGSFPVPATPGVTLAGIPITAVQYTITNDTVRVETVVTGMGPPRYGRLPLSGNLRLCAGGGCATPLSNTMFAIGADQFAYIPGSNGTIVGAPPPPPEALFTSMYMRAVGITGSPPVTLAVSHTSLSQGALQVVTPVLAVSGTFPAPLRQGPASGTSTTVQAGGLIQMVAPFAVVSGATGSLSGGIGHARLSIQLVPEPVGGISLAVGALLLTALGRSRSRRRRRW